MGAGWQWAGWRCVAERQQLLGGSQADRTADAGKQLRPSLLTSASYRSSGAFAPPLARAARAFPSLQDMGRAWELRPGQSLGVQQHRHAMCRYQTADWGHTVRNCNFARCEPAHRPHMHLLAPAPPSIQTCCPCPPTYCCDSSDR